MQHAKTTPVPNVLFDVHLKNLKSAELKVLLIVIRQTLGWVDRQAVLGRKEKDWISGGQLRSKTGCSRHALSSAINTLVKKGLIEISDETGNSLSDPIQRKGKTRLYYRSVCINTSPVENMGKNSLYSHVSSPISAKFAQDLRKEATALAQKMRITKET